jgi:hypothetical protein
LNKDFIKMDYVSINGNSNMLFHKESMCSKLLSHIYVIAFVDSVKNPFVYLIYGAKRMVD